MIRRPIQRVAFALLSLTALAACTHRIAAQPTLAPQIFVFETNELWLNLHHFLYVLGRHELETTDSRRESVAGAPGDQQRGLARLSVDEQALWRDAVQFYKTRLSAKDAVFDQTLAGITLRLADADDAPSLAGVAIDSALTRVLERVAPVYRKGWWPAHRSANDAFVVSVRAPIAQHGVQVLAFIENAYGMKWPAAGYPVHISGYSNWAGAYSTVGNLLVVAGLDTSNRGATGMETLFHEGMHQWDSPVFLQLREHARANNMLVPRSLTHVMIFWTAGEAVKRQIPGHVPYAIRYGVYDRVWSALRDAVAELWQPYLEGRVTRDEAHAALIKRTGERRTQNSERRTQNAESERRIRTQN
jgi:hypothetical protein